MLYLFESTHTVINAEKLCQEKDINYKIIPVPRSISPQCGMAIEISGELEIQVDKILNEVNIKYSKSILYNEI